jgi:hypothetical protein
VVILSPVDHHHWAAAVLLRHPLQTTMSLVDPLPRI